jgi:hypothetical protein
MRSSMERKRGAGSSTILSSMANTSSAEKGVRPMRHLKRTQPSENRSAEGPTSRSPRACSGARYPGVPSRAPVPVSATPLLANLAMPKSRSVTSEARPSIRNRFSGLRSRCTTPAR